MSQTIRATLPGYNALTDTNLDHYSLYADIDNVLIKNKVTGTIGVNSNGTGTIPHNLGYIPFFMVYGSGVNPGASGYKIINNQYGAFSVPDAVSNIDGTNLLITNYSGSNVFAYDVFYDDMSQTGTPSITQSQYAIKVTRPGKDGTSTNPNDYIMHSDLNNFKILKSGTAAVTVGAPITPGSVAHGAIIGTPYKYFAYLKFPDGKVALAGGAVTLSYNGTQSDISNSVRTIMDGTHIYYDTGGGTTSAGTTSYVIYGSGTSGVTGGQVLACTKPGKNALASTVPDDYTFHSNFATLKYYATGSLSMSNVTSTTFGTVAHNLGYTPFFVGFVNDIRNSLGYPNYAIMPFYWSQSSIFAPNVDIGAFMYADSTNLYFKAWFDINATGTVNFTFYYKIFKNNLNI